MTEKTPLAIVQAWQEAVNNQDIEKLLQLSAPNTQFARYDNLKTALAEAGLKEVNEV
jgi:hypothetical protein